MKNIAYIGLGSNLDDPFKKILTAINLLNNYDSKIRILVRSSFYSSKPLDNIPQEDFINAVLKVETDHSPIELLDLLQSIELNMGRVRNKNMRWGPRVIDLDILLFNCDKINNNRLTIPHYDMKRRDFVIVPLFEIAPSLILPDGDLISDVLNNLQVNKLKKIKQTNS